MAQPLGQVDSVEKLVARLFESADHEVTESVDAVPGVVVRFATPRSGLVRPRTYWVIWARCPEPIEAALEQFESDRKRLGADRALAIVSSDPLCGGYHTDLDSAAANAITLRRFALEVSGIAEETRRLAMSSQDQRRSELFLERQGRTMEGQVVNAVEFIERWAGDPEKPDLFLIGPPSSGKSETIAEAAYRVARRFAEDPESASPIAIRGGRAAGEVSQFGWAVMIDSGWVRSPPRGRVLGKGPLAKELPSGLTLELISPVAADFESWYQRHLGGETLSTFRSAHAQVPAFAELTDSLISLTPMLAAMRRTPAGSSTIKEWVAGVTRSHVDSVKFPPQMEAILVRGALEQFALDAVPSFERLTGRRFRPRSRSR